MGLISDLNMSTSSDDSFAAAEKAAHLVSIDSDDSFSQIVTQSTQPEAQTPPQSAIVLQELPKTILNEATPSPRHRPPHSKPVSAPKRMENPVPSTSKAPLPVAGKPSGKHANKSTAAAAILRITNKKKATSSLPKKRPAETPRNTAGAAKTPRARVRLGLSQSRRVVSSQVLHDFSDDDDFDVAKSQAGFPMAKKKRGISRTLVSSCHGSTPNRGTPSSSTKTKKPGSSSARRIIFSDSDSDFDMEKSLPIPKPKRTQEVSKTPKTDVPRRRSHTQPVPKGAYAAAKCDDEYVLKATPMRRLIKDVLAKVKAELHPEGHNLRAADRLTGEALDALCRGAEQHIQEMFELGVIATEHTGRTTIKAEDIRVAEKMKKIIGPNRGLKW